MSKPEAVLRERVGTLDVFKIEKGSRFLIVGQSGSIQIGDWEARELHKWFGENIPPQIVSAADMEHALQEAAQKARADAAPWTNPRV